MKKHLGVLLLMIVCRTAGAQGDAGGKPFVPEPVLPGGLVLPLYRTDSTRLKRERIQEPERYNTSLKNKSDKTLNVINIHNPSIEVHLAGSEPPNTGAAVIVAPGGGHKILWVGPEGADFVPFFQGLGVSTIIYGNGGHGGGLSARGGIPFGTWTARFVDWFKDLGFLEPPGTPTRAAADVEAYARKSAR